MDLTNTTFEDWHAIPADRVEKELQSDRNTGLAKEEAERRLGYYGRNEIPTGKKRSWLLRLAMQFHNVLIYILIVAAVVTALMDHWVDTWVIVSVVAINAIIGFLQEGKAEQALEGIRKMLSLHAVVIRNEKKQTLHAEELVPGDVVLLKAGDKVPADIRLFYTKDFRVEESPLTGESIAVGKNTEAVREDALLGDRCGMAYSGTAVVYGQASGWVVATGAHTELGRINQLLAGVEKITTPLLQQIEEFGKWLSLIILGITAAFFAFGYFFRNYSVVDLFLASIGLVVASIPEGLPAIMTITLAIGVQQMARRNAIIRRLPSVETLGAVNVICSDKTGTLTRNEMTATLVATAEKTYTVEGSGYEPKGAFFYDGAEVSPKEEPVLWYLLQAAKAGNNTEIQQQDDGSWRLTGPPTEGALLAMSYKAGLTDFSPLRLDQIPFESEFKYAAVLSEWEQHKKVFIIGAPDRLLSLCSKQLTDSGEEALNTTYWEQKMEDIASQGKRLLGLAYASAHENASSLSREDLGHENTFLGIVGIIDPARPEVVEAIKACKRAGVQVKMITGDHAVTAKAIGKQIGIGHGDKALTGMELEGMSDEELKQRVLEYDIYARTSPEHKLRLVTALQANGLRCAMTGDGVNDAPALKKANIGIAMGIKGTEVSKDASEMVLADDNFATIVHAIEEGRTVFDNIRKALLFILPTNGAEALVLMAAILLGITMPITPAQILWVNMVTAVTLALALSFEPMERNVMDRKPRGAHEGMLGRLFAWRIIFVSTLIGFFTFLVFYQLRIDGMDENMARTIAVNTLVAGQLFYLFNCRHIQSSAFNRDFFNNPYAFLAAGVLTVLQLVFVYVPAMNTFFGTSPIPPVYWLYSGFPGLAVFLIVEIEKSIMRRFF